MNRTGGSSEGSKEGKEKERMCECGPEESGRRTLLMDE